MLKINRTLYFISFLLLNIHSIFCFLKYIGAIGYFDWGVVIQIMAGLGFFIGISFILPFILMLYDVWADGEMVREKK